VLSFRDVYQLNARGSKKEKRHKVISQYRSLKRKLNSFLEFSIKSGSFATVCRGPPSTRRVRYASCKDLPAADDAAIYAT
jgi:hypothetical protein